MSLKRKTFFLYKIIGMQMHETNTTMSTMYPTFVSVIAEFTDKLNLTYLFIYILLVEGSQTPIPRGASRSAASAKRKAALFSVVGQQAM